MIIVIGAGLAGLTLARVLHRHGIDVEVHDAGPAPAVHRRGGMVSVDAAGRAALDTAGLLDQFGALATDEPVRVLTKDGRAAAPDARPPRADLGDLRAMLLYSLPDDMVHWGSRMVAARPGGEIILDGGVVRHARLLVGADGAWSRVRPLISDAVPAHTGRSWAQARITAAGRGSLVAYGDDRAIVAHREAGADLCVHAVFPTLGAEPVTRADLRAAFADWDPALRELVTGPPPAVRPIHALPVGHRWPRVRGVTLIGDAAHLLSPFAGAGAGLALQDGADLALAIAAHSRRFEVALADHEETMFRRAELAAAEAALHPVALPHSHAPEPAGSRS